MMMLRNFPGIRLGRGALFFGVLLFSSSASRALADLPRPAVKRVVLPVAQPNPLTIKPGRGIGLFRAGMSQAEVKKLLKPEELGEGNEDGKPTLTAYFMDPAKRIALRLDGQGRVIAMTLHGDKSVWHDTRGLQLGTTLEAIEKWNGKPFRVHAFDDSPQAGQILDFGGGRLATELAKVKLTFASPMHAAGYAKLDAAQKSELEKPHDFQSSDAALRLLNPAIETIELTF